MLFSSRPRSHYENAPAHEVICQLRFPAILRIDQEEPAAFQEVIREKFPQYDRRQTAPAPQIRPGPTGPRLEQTPSVINHHFFSSDRAWKLNLTRDSIALSTLHYPGWEAFARMLDKPLATFIQLYRPAYFTRVGLRYINLFSRSRLGLEDAGWQELFLPAYLGPLSQSDVEENRLMACGVDFQIKLDSSCRARIHAGPGRIRTNPPSPSPQQEACFLFDMDLSMGDQVSCTLAAASLETLHGHGTRIFEGAITDRLREAMNPD